MRDGTLLHDMWYSVYVVVDRGFELYPVSTLHFFNLFLIFSTFVIFLSKNATSNMKAFK